MKFSAKKFLNKLLDNKYILFGFICLLLCTSLIIPINLLADSKLDNSSSNNIVIKPVVQLPNDLLISRHAPNINGSRIEGSVRILSSESFSINSSSVVTGNIYIPGTPRINLNGNVTYRGTLTGTGNPQPTNHSINLNSNVTVNHVVTQTDAIEISNVPNPIPTQGTRDVSLNRGQSPGDFSTIRNLTVNSNYGQVEIPQGNYGNFIANSGSGFTLGLDGQTTIYNLTGLTLNSNSKVIIRGFVTINLLNTLSLNSNCIVGDVNSPANLSINISRGGLTLNANSNLYGIVTAPIGTANLNSNSTLKGLLLCDRATLNSNSKLLPIVGDIAGPELTVAEPTEGQIITTATTNITGTISDDSVVTSVKINGTNATINNNNYSLNNFPLTLGTNILNIVATDIFGNASTVIRTVTRSDGTNQAPVVDAGANQVITLPNSASLNGNITDDGLPQPTNLSITWSKVNGDGNVTFSSPNSAQTTATFSSAGTYVLKLMANDGELTGEDTVTITVNLAAAQNQAPITDAGQNQSITLPNNTISLLGQVTDDGLPNPPAQTTVLWTKKDGNGTVTFSSPNSLATTATFSNSGTYTLTLTSSDNELQSSDDVVITVNPQAQTNMAPTVNAGQDQSVTLPNTVTLTATVTDDSLPNPPGQLTYSWSKITGPGEVTFSNQTALTTQISFSQAGTFTIRFSASDGELVATDEVMISVSPAVANQAPVVNVGDDQVINLPDGTNLMAVVSDDGLPSSTLTYSWSVVSGPSNNVVFSNPTELNTTVTFTVVGTYVLQLTASDSLLESSDIISIVVKPQPIISLLSTIFGFEPDSISIATGTQKLFIRNRTGLDSLVYKVSNSSGVIAQVTVDANQDAFVEINFTAGSFTVSVDGYDWSAQILVVP